MMKKISALLLSIVLCLSLTVNVFADDTVTIDTLNAGDTVITVRGVDNGTYSPVSVAQDGVNLGLFVLVVKGGVGTINVGKGLTGRTTVTLHIPGVTDINAPASKYVNGGGGGGAGGGGGSSVSHRIEVVPTTNGTIKVSPATAVQGEKVTITVTPNEGYELDTLKAADANSNELELTKVDDSTCTFLMANTTVTVTGTFKKTGAVSFSDVPSSHTFYADIMWAAERGYMNGYSDGTFRPDNNTTRQALWMVLGRIDGALNADSAMSSARTWAMGTNVSDGTNPERAMSRQQMVTMLYRYAQQKGYKTDGGSDISAYPDAGSVADYAKDAMSWAVGNGIVNGTSDGRLNPEGTALRSHFAAFLHRFCQTAGIA